MKMLNKLLFYISHLKDVDDLKKWGRNPPVENSLENNTLINGIADCIIRIMLLKNKTNILFVSSDKKRAIQTSHLLGKKIEDKTNNKFGIKYLIQGSLKGNEQGEIILPETYKPGDYFDGFKIGSKIYQEETFHKSNLDYKFGDPVKVANEEYRYPELLSYFKSPGESYREIIIRLFSLLLDLSNDIEKMNSSDLEIIIVAHGLPYQIFRGLSIIANKIKCSELSINEDRLERDLLLRIWNIYKDDPGVLKNQGYDMLDYSPLESKQIVDLLQRKVDSLKKYE